MPDNDAKKVAKRNFFLPPMSGKEPPTTNEVLFGNFSSPLTGVASAKKEDEVPSFSPGSQDIRSNSSKK